MKKKYGLGTGFDSLIPTEFTVNDEFDRTREADEKISSEKMVKLSDIVRDEEQPRQEFDEESLQELADSIKEHGILQPIVVTKKGDKYQIVAGERRYRAAGLAGLEKVPVIVRSIDDQTKLELMIVENVQREDLSPLELATAYVKMKNQFNYTEEEIGKKVGKSANSVINTMRLLKLPEKAQKIMQEKRISEGPMRPLIGKDDEIIEKVLPKIVDEGWSTRQVERYLADNKKKSSANIVKKSTFVSDEARLCEKYGAEVRIRGRSVTMGVKNEEELRKLLERL